MTGCRVDTEHLSACPLCGERGRRPLCASRDRQYGVTAQKFTYSRCNGCDVVYQSRRPVEDRIATFYPDNYRPYQATPVVVRADPGAPATGPHFTAADGAPPRMRRWAMRAVERLNRIVQRRYPDPLPRILDAIHALPRSGAT